MILRQQCSLVDSTGHCLQLNQQIVEGLVVTNKEHPKVSFFEQRTIRPIKARNAIIKRTISSRNPRNDLLGQRQFGSTIPWMVSVRHCKHGEVRRRLS
uniref:Uncharacterized protein n=1 Tax=Bursaphelenchus xylophilus TaxID=6326 RepID=A0A1I7SDJ9_BURXY